MHAKRGEARRCWLAKGAREEGEEPRPPPAGTRERRKGAGAPPCPRPDPSPAPPPAGPAAPRGAGGRRIPAPWPAAAGRQEAGLPKGKRGQGRLPCPAGASPEPPPAGGRGREQAASCGLRLLRKEDPRAGVLGLAARGTPRGGAAGVGIWAAAGAAAGTNGRRDRGGYLGNGFGVLWLRENERERERN
jgi:hypothetical protein